MKEHGLRKGNLQVRDEALLEIIRYYTREAGVRSWSVKLQQFAVKQQKLSLSGEKKARYCNREKY